MARRTKAFILDAWALLAFLDGGDAGKGVANLVYDANEESTPLFVSVLSMGEVFSVVSQTSSVKDAENTLSEFVQLGIEFIDLDIDIIKSASQQRIEYGLGLIDSVLVALAVQHKGVLVTGNPALKTVENAIKIQWILS